ncbi:MAG: hypothetical protein ACKO7U_04865 [Actinomycetota bacterium]
MAAFSDPRWFDREGAVERVEVACRAVPQADGSMIRHAQTQSGAELDVVTLRVAEGPLTGRHAGLLIWPPRRPGDLERTLGPLAAVDDLEELAERLAVTTLRCRLETSPFGDLEVRKVLDLAPELPVPEPAGPVPPDVPADLLPDRPDAPPAARVQVIANAAQVREAAELLSGLPVLAVDIETACTRLPPDERETRDAFEPWNGTVRLVQVAAAAPDGVLPAVVIDCWEADPLPVLRLLGEPGRQVIAHNAKFEQSWIAYRWGIEFGAVVDTMAWWSVIAGHLAAAGADSGVEDARLVTLVERFLGLELDKSFQTSDWSLEELSDGQLEYAGLDAAVLVPLAATLAGIATRLGCAEQARIASMAGARRAAASVRFGADRHPDEADEARAMIANAASAADLETAGALMRRMALRAGSREELAEAFRARRQALASPSAS